MLAFAACDGDSSSVPSQEGRAPDDAMFDGGPIPDAGIPVDSTTGFKHRWCKDSTLSTTAQLRAVWSTGPGQWIVAGTQGTVQRHNGTSWQAIPTGDPTQLNGVWASNSNDVYVVGESTAVRRFDGAVWSKIADASRVSRLNAIWGSDAQHIYTMGDSGNGTYVTVFEDGAWQTSVVSTTMAYNVKSIWSTSSANLVIAGSLWNERQSMLGILSYPWPLAKFHSVESAPVLYGIWGSEVHYGGNDEAGSPILEEVFAVGSKGTIAHRVGNFTNWSTTFTSSNPTSVTLRGVWGTGTTDVVAVGDQGTILAYDGTSWNAEPIGTSVNLYAVTGSRTGQVMAVGDEGTILWRVNDGAACP